MPSSTRPATIRQALILLALAAAAVPAVAEERCTGTLCDLYYGGPPPETPPGAAQAAPTPLTVPGTGLLGKMFGGGATAPAAPGATTPPPAPATRPLLGVGGGGLIGMARGVPSERCGGTLCDLYYGSPSPEEQRAARGEAQPSGGVAPPPAQAAAQEADEAPAPAPTRRRVYRAEPETPRCAATVAHDPWSCYR